MTPRQRFKFAFIARCIDLGYTTPAQVLSLAKQAAEKQGFGVAGGMASLAGVEGLGEGLDWLKNLGVAGLAGLAAAPPVAGYVGGRLLAQGVGAANDMDADEIKKRELALEYQRQAARLQRAGLVRRHEETQPAGRSF